jgi:hypothetical protein
VEAEGAEGDVLFEPIGHQDSDHLADLGLVLRILKLGVECGPSLISLARDMGIDVLDLTHNALSLLVPSLGFLEGSHHGLNFAHDAGLLGLSDLRSEPSGGDFGT